MEAGQRRGAVRGPHSSEAPGGELVASRDPARGWGLGGVGVQPCSFSPSVWAKTATCLRPRHQERKSSRSPRQAATAAGKTRAGARTAPHALLARCHLECAATSNVRVHKAAAILSLSQLDQPSISPILPLLPTAGTQRLRD